MAYARRRKLKGGSRGRKGWAYYIGFTDRHGIQKEQVCRGALGLTHAEKLAHEKERKESLLRMGLAEEVPERMRFRALVEKYEKTVVPLHKSAGTTRSQLRRLEKQFGDTYLDEFTPALLLRYLTSLLGELAPRSVEYLRVRVQTLFRFAIKDERCFRGENPAAPLAKRIKVPKRKIRFLQKGDVLRVVLAATPEFQGLFAYAFLTGARKGEICGQLKADVDQVGRVLNIRHSYEGTTKGHQERTAPIPDTLWPFIERQLRTPGPYLFPNADGSMRSKNWKGADRFRTALKAAGLVSGYRLACLSRGSRKGCGFTGEQEAGGKVKCPNCGMGLRVEAIPLEFTLKHTRSTYGTHAYRSHGDIRAVQQQLGHRDVATTTEHYAESLIEHRREQANNMALLPSGAESGPVPATDYHSVPIDGNQASPKTGRDT